MDVLIPRETLGVVCKKTEKSGTALWRLGMRAAAGASTGMAGFRLDPLLWMTAVLPVVPVAWERSFRVAYRVPMGKSKVFPMFPTWNTALGSCPEARRIRGRKPGIRRAFSR